MTSMNLGIEGQTQDCRVEPFRLLEFLDVETGFQYLLDPHSEVSVLIVVPPTEIPAVKADIHGGTGFLHATGASNAPSVRGGESNESCAGTNSSLLLAWLRSLLETAIYCTG